MPRSHMENRKQVREKMDFRSKLSSCIEMQLRERKNSLIKCDITRYIYVTGSNIKAFEPLVQVTIAKKTHSLDQN
jgi:hypothetical protein